MSLTITNVIEIPDSADSQPDYGAFDPKTRRAFIAHTACSSVEVIDHDGARHIATLHNFSEAASVVIAEGQVLRDTPRSRWLLASATYPMVQNFRH
jgi:hypothetical protein